MSTLGPIDDLYREVILDHHRSPRGREPLTDPDVEAEGKNPSCGDEVTLQLKFDGETISQVGVLAHGCAISTSSGSMLADLVEGRTVGEAARIAEAFRQVLHGKKFPTDVDLGDLEALEGVQKFPVRIKCAVLPWVTLLDAVLAQRAGRDPRPVSTEGLGDDANPMNMKITEGQ
ncbi:MAG: SUF system NifU family Fe-S cluster assembly protein [bacterium]|nr:SUF system NifU family Fe-S cluster assembly protein [bacterium]